MSEQTGETFEKRYFEAHRRLAISRQLGVQSTRQHVELELIENLERRRRDEIISGLAEGLQGAVASKYEFGLVEGKLVAEDGEPIEDMLWRALSDARKRAAEDSFYQGFLVERTQHELQELVEQEAMCRGERDFNTIVTFSPFTEEKLTPATEQKITIAGQKPYWRRGMVRVSHWDGQKLHIVTRSIDNSSVALFADVAKEELGYGFGQVDSTAMLGERIHMVHHGDSWAEIADNLAAAADHKISSRFGETVKQGIPLSRARDAMSFVESQQNIITHLMQHGRVLSHHHDSYTSWKLAFEDSLRQHLALLDERFIGNHRTQMNPQDIRIAAESAGARADAAGKSYDMCGYVLGAKAAISARSTGFESLSRLIGQKVQCPNCKEKVVVPSEKLEKGHLYCNGCHLDVDVCTGKTRYEKPARPRRKPRHQSAVGKKRVRSKWWEIPPAA